MATLSELNIKIKHLTKIELSGNATAAQLKEKERLKKLYVQRKEQVKKLRLERERIEKEARDKKERQRLEEQAILSAHLAEHPFPFNFGDIFFRVFSKTTGQNLLIIGQPELILESVWTKVSETKGVRFSSRYAHVKVPTWKIPVMAMEAKYKNPVYSSKTKKTKKKEMFLTTEDLKKYKLVTQYAPPEPKSKKIKDDEKN